jgi:SOS regulatory protein LexA
MSPTERRQALFAKLLRFQRQYGYWPSYAELQRVWEFKSKNAVAQAVAALEKESLIHRNDRGAIVGCHNPLPLLGSVRAGTPTPADEEVAELDTIDDFLIRRRDRTFLLRVAGDSMKDAGLMEGDIVVLERGTPPRHGDIVVARLDNEWTVKHFILSRRGPELHPANEAYKPIIPEGEMEVAGKVVGSFRKYR